MWPIALLAARALAAESPAWDLLTLDGKLLQRVHGPVTETVTLVDFIPAPDGEIDGGVSAVLASPDSLYIWGRFGLGWVNLATRRSVRLTAFGHEVSQVQAAGGWLVYQLDGGLRAWSEAEGHEIVLSDVPCERLWTASTGAVAWSDAQGIHLVSKATLDATDGGGRAASCVVAPSASDITRDVAFAPDGSTVVVFSISEEEDAPLVAAWFDPQGHSLRTETYANPEGMSLGSASWSDGAAPTVELLNEFMEHQFFVPASGRLTSVEYPSTPNPPATPTPGVTLTAKKIQGHHELFATDGARTWQVTDLAAVRPDPVSPEDLALQRLGGEVPQADAVDEIGWWPMADARHVLVAAIRSWDWWEPDWGTSSHAYLVDLGATAPGQIDLGVTAMTSGDGDTAPSSGAEASAATSWGFLGNYSPDREIVITQNGSMLTSRGVILTKVRRHDWMTWMPAKPSSPAATIAPADPSVGVPTEN